MKRKWAIFAAIAVLAIGVYLLVTARHDKVTAADFLPEEILVVVEQQELGPLLADFKGSRLGRAITAIDFVKISSDLGMPAQELETISAVRRQMDDFLNSQVFQEFFGREFTLAFLPVADTALADPEKTATSSLLFISRPSHDADILKLATTLFARQLNQTSTRHGAYTINHYAVEEGLVLSAATVEGFVLAAFDEGLVRAGLDRFTAQSSGKNGSLAQNSEYIRLRHEFVDAKLFAYVSVPMLHAQAGRLAANLDMPEQEELLKAIDQWKGWNGMAFGAWKEEGRIRDKGVILFNREKQDALVAGMCGVTPAENKSYAMVPADIIGYYWTNTLNMTMFWEMFTREMEGSEEQLKSMEQDVKTSTGLELGQILAMFGSEAALLLKEVVTDGFIPLPHGALLLKIEKEEELLKLLQSQLARMDIPIQTGEYKGTALHSLDISFHPSLRPVYALYQGYLILAGTVDMVKMMIDSRESGGLTGEKSFQQVNEGLHKGLTGANNSVSYLKVSSLLQMIRDLANWGGTILSMQDPEVALKSKVVLEQLVLPLLDGFAMYEVMGARSVIRDDAIVLESTMILAQ